MTVPKLQHASIAANSESCLPAENLQFSEIRTNLNLNRFKSNFLMNFMFQILCGKCMKSIFNSNYCDYC